MLSVEFPNGFQLAIETPEALARAVQNRLAQSPDWGTPLPTDDQLRILTSATLLPSE